VVTTKALPAIILEEQRVVYKLKTVKETFEFGVRSTKSWSRDKLILVNQIQTQINQYLSTVTGIFAGFSATSNPILCLTPFAYHHPIIVLTESVLADRGPINFKQLNKEQIINFLTPLFKAFDPHPYLAPPKLVITISCTTICQVIPLQLKRDSRVVHSHQHGGPDAKYTREDSATNSDGDGRFSPAERPNV
jgi:hypothetical protein